MTLKVKVQQQHRSSLVGCHLVHVGTMRAWLLVVAALVACAWWQHVQRPEVPSTDAASWQQVLNVSSMVAERQRSKAARLAEQIEQLRQHNASSSEAMARLQWRLSRLEVRERTKIATYEARLREDAAAHAAAEERHAAELKRLRKEGAATRAAAEKRHAAELEQVNLELRRVRAKVARLRRSAQGFLASAMRKISATTSDDIDALETALGPSGAPALGPSPPALSPTVRQSSRLPKTAKDVSKECLAQGDGEWIAHNQTSEPYMMDPNFVKGYIRSPFWPGNCDDDLRRAPFGGKSGASHGSASAVASTETPGRRPVRPALQYSYEAMGHGCAALNLRAHAPELARRFCDRFAGQRILIVGDSTTAQACPRPHTLEPSPYPCRPEPMPRGCFCARHGHHMSISPFSHAHPGGCILLHAPNGVCL